MTDEAPDKPYRKSAARHLAADFRRAARPPGAAPATLRDYVKAEAALYDHLVALVHEGDRAYEDFLKAFGRVSSYLREIHPVAFVQFKNTMTPLMENLITLAEKLERVDGELLRSDPFYHDRLLTGLKKTCRATLDIAAAYEGVMDRNPKCGAAMRNKSGEAAAALKVIMERNLRETEALHALFRSQPFIRALSLMG